MKKFFMMAVAAIAALSSCSNDDAILGEGGKQNGEGVTTFTATIESEATTRTTLTIDKKVFWVSNDVIKINGKEYKATNLDGVKADFVPVTEGQTAEADGGKYHAYYPSTIAASTNSEGQLPAEYEYKSDASYLPMYAVSENTTLAFKNLCGVLAITVPSTEMTSVKSITVSSDKQLNGEILSISAAGVLTFKTEGITVTDAMKKVKLTFSTAKTISSSETFYIPVPADTHNPLRIVISNDTKTKVMLTRKSGGVLVERNKFYPITFAHNDQNLLAGVFSVSDTKKVLFTKGNLQATYNGSTYTWGFAANQWDYVGNAEGNTSITSDGKNTDGKVVDLFGWSTSATNYGINTSTIASTYSGDFKDWGENFPGKYYSTLSKDEWTYLLTTRTVNGGTAEGKSYQRTTLTLSDNTTTRYGILITPDDYTGTLSNTTSWSDWQTMESAGVVFLPAAGYRHDSSVDDAGSSGNYWSSTVPDYDSYAYYLYFTSDKVYPASRIRYCGKSVRLVSVTSE